MAYRAGVDEFVLGTELLQIGKELPPKELRHHFDREEEVILAGLPTPTTLGQSSSGNDVVDMRMVHEILTPGVQNRDKTDVSAKMLPGFRELGQGF